MKRILFVSHALELGGAERALLGLLEAIDYSKLVVDLFLMRHSGEMMQYIPKEVNLLPEIPQYSTLAVPAKEVIKKGQFRIAWGRYYGKKYAKKRVLELGLPADNDVALQYSHLYTLPYMPAISDKVYDAAISFLTPHYFVREKVIAKKKIAWIHTDYGRVAIDRNEQLKMWSGYDKIVAVSEEVKNAFIGVFPTLKGKIEVIKNIIPVSIVDKQKNEFSVQDEMPDDGSIKLLSIGRFCNAKNFDNIPFICKKLLEKGCNVKWYIIGFGSDEVLIRQRIEEAGMHDYVILLGKKDNPYPFLQKCDLYVQPSRYEGRCVSVVEAQMLQKPVVITNYATASSQLNDGVDGIIVPMDNEGCAKGIEHLLRDTETMKRLSMNCCLHDYTSLSEIKNFYRLITH